MEEENTLKRSREEEANVDNKKPRLIVEEIEIEKTEEKGASIEIIGTVESKTEEVVISEEVKASSDTKSSAAPENNTNEKAVEVIILEGDPIENAATQLEKVHSKIIEIKADFDSNEAESNTSEKTKEVIVLECDPTEDAPTKLDSSSSKIKFSDGDPSLAPEGLVHEE